MANHAPGFEPARQGPRPCYNCGMTGHLFTACPEPTRSVPAGLEASRQRQIASNSPNSEKYMSGKRSKGPIITRYLPPNPSPAGSHHDHVPGTGYAPGVPPGYPQPPPPPYAGGYGPPPLGGHYGRDGRQATPRSPPGPHSQYNHHTHHQTSYDYRHGPGPPPPQFSYGPPYEGPFGPPQGPPPSGPLHMSHGQPHAPSYDSPYDLPPAPHYASPRAPAHPTPYGPPPDRFGHYHPSPPGQYPPGQYPPGPLGLPPGQYFPPSSPYPPSSYYGPSDSNVSSAPLPPGHHPPSYGGPPPGSSRQSHPQYPFPLPEPHHRAEYTNDRGSDRWHRNGHWSRDDYRSYRDRHPQEHWREREQEYPRSPRDSRSRDDWRHMKYHRERDDHQYARNSRTRGHREGRKLRMRDDEVRTGQPRSERPRNLEDRQQSFETVEKTAYGSKGPGQPETETSTEPASISSHTTPLVHERDPVKLTPAKTPRDVEPGEIGSDGRAESELGDTDSVSGASTGMTPYGGFHWDKRTIFKEYAGPREDPIAKPLPAEYSEEIMVPPAYDAQGVKSDYVNPQNLDDFALDVRETKDWQVMQHHPLFLDTIDIRPDCLLFYARVLEYGPSNNKVGQQNNNRNQRHRGKQRTLQDRHSHKGHQQGDFQHHDFNLLGESRKRHWQESQDYPNANAPGIRRDYFPHSEHGHKRPKPASPEPGELIEMSGQAPLMGQSEMHHSSVHRMGDPSAIDATETYHREPVEFHSKSPGPTSVQRSSPEPTSRHSQTRPDWERRTHLHVETQAQSHSTPRPRPPPPGLPSVTSRPGSRRSSQSYHSSRRSSKSQPSGHRNSQPNSRRSSLVVPGADVLDSPLTPTERELLGLISGSTSGSDAGRDSPVRQLDDVTPKFRRRQPKVDAVYSRRW
ncbi:hypothetical protein GGR56DRAFT_189693 [Xylariaceae sp. FL0804]|nr:hypothetical protein GGR56DRAFT_189693 [Xylariaceae sp. FL0804]